MLCIPQIKYQGHCFSYQYIGSQSQIYSTLSFLHKIMGPLNSCSFSDGMMKLCYLCGGDGTQYDGAFLPYSSVLLLHVRAQQG